MKMEEDTLPPLLVFIIILITFIGLTAIFIKAVFGITKEYRKEYQQKKYYNRNLLILASVIIKADGFINQTEIDFVRLHFVKTYGKDIANKAFKQFREIVLSRTNIRTICLEIREMMSYQEMLNLIDFLFEIADADEKVSVAEELEIRKIASYLYLSEVHYEEIRDYYFTEEQQNYTKSYSNTSDYHYEILGLTEKATNEEIKKSYRNLVKKYHPDKLQNTSKQDIYIAKEKFQKIQKAYSNIKNQRKF